MPASHAMRTIYLPFLLSFITMQGAETDFQDRISCFRLPHILRDKQIDISKVSLYESIGSCLHQRDIVEKLIIAHLLRDERDPS